MTPTTQAPATLDDLMRVKGQAELIGGRIVRPMPSGMLPNRVAKRIVRRLDDYAETVGRGEAFTDNLGYAIDPPLPSGRQSFSPDASYHLGPFPANEMEFIDGGPTFAVEVRSEHDYGPAIDREYEDKPQDYFQAGTRVVWDVDPIAETVTKYTAADPANPTVFRRGDVADAEPALPGWRLSVDDIFA
ncbi:MAG: Uma2 family endonuclease [Gemmataceae bacterium]|nr:Uma2 family endonuclease [Gemmataceae bacterium]